MATEMENPGLTSQAQGEERVGKWGMTIDQDLCTGCQACVAACSMENNVPFVSEEDSGYGRFMQWIRIERLWKSMEYPVVEMTPYQPMLCQQCGNAPCEPVCPVYASVHSLSQDLNLQVYNRCVGTRYCGNNCPYQVRAFNWWDYQDERIHKDLVTLHNSLNPDVTVRRRGVMEKCTFCIQRIHKAEDTARATGQSIDDVEFTSACAQACPTNAIVFGRLDDPASQVNQDAQDNQSRAYHALEEVRTVPRITYLKGGV
jgi:molybdopterin-containing oxidoreductase family iron-sulfur binding subunit